jgi:hypothetical protein
VKLRVNKLDAARRQIDTAICMLFAEDDPVAVHTLVCAGWQVLRDLCENVARLAIKPSSHLFGLAWSVNFGEL